MTARNSDGVHGHCRAELVDSAIEHTNAWEALGQEAMASSDHVIQATNNVVRTRSIFLDVMVIVLNHNLSSMLAILSSCTD